jgi:hypothetical protein
MLAGLMLVAGPGAARAAKPSPPVGGSKDCGWRVSRDYGPESMTYRLRLDLAGCRWWDGSERSLHVSLRRADGPGDGAAAARSAPAPCTGPTARCDASATIAHPEGETARYAGQATWNWDDGQHQVTFATTCTTTSETVSCADDRPASG